MNEGDRLLALILQGASDEEYGLEQHLVQALHEGYPVSNLRPLLQAADENIVASGTWVLAKIGPFARPLFHETVKLLHHPYINVRCNALACLLPCATPEDVDAMVAGLALLADPEPGARRAALDFAARAPAELLEPVRRQATAGSVHAKGLHLMLDGTRLHLAREVISALESDDILLRSYAAVAAARMVDHHAGALKHAIGSSDLNLRYFAEDVARKAGF